MMPGNDPDRSRPSIEQTWPHPGFRKYQEEALKEASSALWEEGYDTVVEVLPTGLGKSPINLALCRQARSAFYTTPQKNLRTQLEEDETLRSHYKVLRGRADYMCEYAGRDSDRKWNCSDCPVYVDRDRRCADQDFCSYWEAKEEAMEADIAVLTFAGLIVDGKLNTYAEVNNDESAPDITSWEQVSFSDRELLVVDEAHSLADQMASMWAGFTIGGSLPDEVYDKAIPRERLTRAINGHEDIWLFEQLEDTFENIAVELEKYRQKKESEVPTVGEIASARGEKAAELEGDRHMGMKKIDRCSTLMDAINTAWEDIASGRPWVVNLEWSSNTNEKKPVIEAKPVEVDRILNEKLWHRTDKRVLSTATAPYPDDLDRWMNDLGLDPDEARYIQYPMPFDVENRPVYLNDLDRMSGGGFKANLQRIVEAVRWLAERYEGEKGLVHTVSFERAELLHNRLEDIAVLHDQQERAISAEMDDQAFLDKWQEGDKPVYLSPSCMEGVDLKDDMCRWQALPKVPYPNLGDSRVKYITEKADNSAWYAGQTAMGIMQAVGRGVRSPDDYCDFYILDSCYRDVARKVAFPEWFTESVQER